MTLREFRRLWVLILRRDEIKIFTPVLFIGIYDWSRDLYRDAIHQGVELRFWPVQYDFVCGIVDFKYNWKWIKTITFWEHYHNNDA